MAVSEELLKQVRQRAKLQDAYNAQITDRVVANASKNTVPTQPVTQSAQRGASNPITLPNFDSNTNPREFAMNLGGQTNWNWGVDPLKDVKETYRLSTYDVDKASEHVTDYRKQLVQIQDEMSRLRYQQGAPGVKERYAQLRAQAEELDNKISKTNTAIEKATEIQDSIAYQEEIERLLPLDIEGTKAQKTAKEQQLKPIQEKIKAIELELKYPSGNSPFGSVADMQAELKRLQQTANNLTKEIPALGNDITEARRLQAFYQKGEEYSALMGNADFDYYTAQGASIVARDNYANPDLWLQTAKQSDPTPGVVGSQRDIEQASRQNLGDKDRRSLAREMAGSYKYMTKDEFNIYCYLLAKEGRASAQQYEIYLAETLNAREGKEKGEAIRNIENKHLRRLATAGSAVVGGLDTVVHSAHQLINEERIPTHAAQYTSQTVRNDLGAVGKVAYDALYGVSQMAPSILVSSVLGPGAGAVVQGLSSAGGAYNQALADGYTKQEATDYALLIGASEAVLQKTLGGIDKLGGMSGKIAKAVSRIDDALLRVASQAGLSMLSEAGEEYLQAVLEPVYRNWLLDEENKIDLLSDEALYSGLVGALISAGFNVPDMLHSLGDARLERTATPISNQKDLDSALAKALAELRAQPTGEERLNESARMILEQKKNAQTTDVGTENNSRLTDADLAEYLTVGEREHVRNTKHNQIKAGDSPILTSISAIKDFILNSALGRISNTIKAYGKVGKSMAADVMSASDGAVDINGYYLELEANHLNHLNDHVQDDGDPRNIPLTQEQLLQLPEYIDNYDDVLAVVTKKNGSKRIYLGKEINGHSVVVVLVSKGRRSIHPQTAWTNSTDHYREKYGKKRSTKYIPTTETVEDSGYRSASNPHIPQPEQSVNRENVDDIGAQPAMGAGVGDMGAKTSDFRHEVKESQSKTTPHYYEQHNIPEQGRADNHYTVVHEDESLNNARLRLEQDYEGEVDELRGKASWSNEEMDMGQMVLDDLRSHAEKTGDWSGFRAWARVVNEHKTEAGRSLQALAKYNRDTGSAILSYASKLLENASKGTDVNAVMQTVSEFADRYDGAVDSRDVDSLVQIIRDTSNVRKTGTLRKNAMPKEINWALNRIAEMAKTDDNAYSFLQSFAAVGIENIAGDHQRLSVGNAVKTIRYNAMLSKAATVLRNLVGNGVFDGLDTIARDISVPLDMFLSKFTGTRSIAVDKYYFSEAKRKGSLDGLAMALMEAGLDVNASGATNKYEGSSSRTFKMSGKGLSRFLSAWEKWTAYNMQVTDEFAKGGTSAEIQRGIDALYAQGKIKDDSLRDAGQQTALYRTFQDDTVLSRMTTGVRDVFNIPTNWASKKDWYKNSNALRKIGLEDFGAGDMTMPFAKIPANLASRVIDYTPINALIGIVRLAFQGATGTLTAADQAKAVQSIGRGVTGTALIAGFTALAAKGIIRAIGAGGEEDNKDKVAAEKAQGVTGTQFNVSAAQRWISGEDPAWREGDTLVSIGFLDPINAHMAMGALIAEDMKDGLTYTEMKDATLAGVVQAVADLPVMQTIKDATNAFQYSDADNFGGKLRDATFSYLAGQATSLIPNSIKGIAQGLDGTQRDAYTSDTLWGQTVDNIKASLPGLRNTLPAKLDSYGREMKNEGGFRNFMNSNINPGAVTTYHEDAVDRMARDLYTASKGNTSIYPDRKPPNTIDIGDETVRLTSEQKREYQRDRGTVEHDVKNALGQNDDFSGFDTKMQIKAWNYAEDLAKQTAKEDLGIGYEAESWVRDLEGASRNERAEAIVQRVVENIAKDHEGGKYAGLGAMLDEGSITGSVALLACADTVVDAYVAHCKSVGVSAEQWIDVYGYANSIDGSPKEQRERTLRYIELLSVSSKKKIALANALFDAKPSFIPVDGKIPSDWLEKVTR